MSFELRVYFLGLAAFTEHQGKWHVLFPDASDAFDFRDGESIMPHSLVAQVNASRIVDATSLDVFTDRAGTKMGLWPIEKEYFALSPHTRINETELTTTMGEEVAQIIPSATRLPNHMGWLAPIPGKGAEDGHEIGTLKRGLLQDPLPPAAQDLLQGTHIIGNGSLDVAGFSTFKKNYIVWDLGFGVHRAAANCVVYTCTVLDQNVSLVTRDFGTGEETGRLTLDPDGHGLLEVFLMNRRKDIIKSQQEYRDPNRVVTPSPISHYREYLHYFRLLKHPPDPDAYPYPKSVQDQGVAPINNFGPAPKPCHDPAMRRQYFSSLSPGNHQDPKGSVSCSPARVKSGEQQ